ncbi:AAA family ATPase [Spirosoma lituiforme]
MPFRLTSFRVTKFRSIDDSGELHVDKYLCLVGTNESGKTNLLAALHKLNPADNAPIDPLADYPRKHYLAFENNAAKEPFIRATFATDAKMRDQLASIVGLDYPMELLATVEVARYYTGAYNVHFPASCLEQYPNKHIHTLLSTFWETYLTSELITRDKEENTQDLREFIDRLIGLLPESGSLGEYDVYNLVAQIDEFSTVKYSRRQPFRVFVDEQVKTPLENIARLLANKRLVLSADQQRLFLDQLPRFVYYSEYNNLDTEIYLPHVIQNSTRPDLSIREQAKVRTLNLLFDFVQLKPDEILALGAEVSQTTILTRDSYGRIESTEIEAAPENTVEQERANKKKREVSLQTASAHLTAAFQDWWRQGAYRFRFQADGNHFRIWVCDEKRTEEIELDGRSKGLQWFFSFFLTFRAGQKGGHANCILLLDEPGLSLHPTAQQDLLAFLHSLAQTNQLVYTTHSPFMIGSQALDNLNILHIGSDGHSVVSDAYSASTSDTNASFYPIRAALNLTLSDHILTGHSLVLVDGASSQVYLQLMQSYLLKMGHHPPTQTLLFIPTASPADVEPLACLLAQQAGAMPYVLLDGTACAAALAKTLQETIYKDVPDRVITLGESQWLEDLFPANELARQFSRMYRGQKTDDFDYLLQPDASIVAQIQSFAEANAYVLAHDWRLTLAQRTAKAMDTIATRLKPETVRQWVDLLSKLA